MKSRQTRRTITRLVEMKRRTAEKAEAAHALAHGASAAAEQHRIDADRCWLAALDANEAIGNAGDLEERDGIIRSLRRCVDEAERRFLIARANEAAARDVMVEARVELRRFEVWLEREAEERAVEVRRVGRIAEDEVATRKRSVG